MTTEQAAARAAFLRAFGLAEDLLLIPASPLLIDEGEPRLLWVEPMRSNAHPDALADIMFTVPEAVT